MILKKVKKVNLKTFIGTFIETIITRYTPHICAITYVVQQQ